MIENVFVPSLKNAPRKKFRGKKRYFRKILDEAHSFSPSLGADDWYDMWHYHADWGGYGNLSWKYRLKHIEALCIIYKKFIENLPEFKKPYQLWIYLNQNDSGQDAVFFHTPNPNENNFPCKFNDAQWDISPIEVFFSKILSLPRIRCCQQEGEGSKIFMIYSPDHGVPFEQESQLSHNKGIETDAE